MVCSSHYLSLILRADEYFFVSPLVLCLIKRDPQHSILMKKPTATCSIFSFYGIRSDSFRRDNS